MDDSPGAVLAMVRMDGGTPSATLLAGQGVHNIDNVARLAAPDMKRPQCRRRSCGVTPAPPGSRGR